MVLICIPLLTNVVDILFYLFIDILFVGLPFTYPIVLKDLFIYIAIFLLGYL